MAYQQTPLWATGLCPPQQAPFSKEADTITSFLTPMLCLYPDKLAIALPPLARQGFGQGQD